MSGWSGWSARSPNSRNQSILMRGGWVAQAIWSRLRRLCGGWPVQTNYIARLGLSQVSQSEPSVAIFLRIKLMGPEEIHIYFLEGAPRPQKENMIDPKTWNFF